MKRMNAATTAIQAEVSAQAEAALREAARVANISAEELAGLIIQSGLSTPPASGEQSISTDERKDLSE